MKPRASDSAVPSVIPTPGITPQLRRVPAGTPLATPIVRILDVADGTTPAPRISHRRGLRTLLIALVATSAALAVALTLYTRAARREEIENRYPIVAEGAAAQTIDRELARWSAGKPRLVRALTRFEAPALGSLVGAGACTLTGPGLRFTAGPDLAAEVSEAIDELLDRARRGRFGSGEALDEVVAQLSGPVTVAHGAVSYAFDPATGTLACAGSGTLRAVE